MHKRNPGEGNSTGFLAVFLKRILIWVMCLAPAIFFPAVFSMMNVGGVWGRIFSLFLYVGIVFLLTHMHGDLGLLLLHCVILCSKSYQLVCWSVSYFFPINSLLYLFYIIGWIIFFCKIHFLKQ